jgi:hypothetical protein
MTQNVDSPQTASVDASRSTLCSADLSNAQEGQLAVAHELDQQIDDLARRIRDGFMHDYSGRIREYFQGKLSALEVARNAVKDIQ